ncbi:hypothetical protein QVD17_19208 [Tagetes erecta]|uniref:Jacalin-type lectin domain-containing protein n=1 Tax=Tagetes erecta TaxID=13708 RepID=A0AAD8KJB7_TARER|nr:hypothetical protein QVD17_19208 [Tagetes erecta]
MTWIMEKLERALELQINNPLAGVIRVGTCGKQIKGLDHTWSFGLEQGYMLKKLTITHGDIGICSLMFTTAELSGVLHTSTKVGDSDGGHTVSEITFDSDEEILAIIGSIRTVISSLSLQTNKRTHGPFGRVSDSVFSIPWDKGSLVGFYGIADHYIDGIGVFVKAHEEIMRVGTWGTSKPGGPQNKWSFQLEKNHHLNMITIDHGDLIYSLMFTTNHKLELTHTSQKYGGWNGGDVVSEVTFDWNEEIIAISGTVASSRGKYAGYTIISSISFVTNKRTHGPFGSVRGTHFTTPWDDGSFAGFYGLCGYYIDSIGVYLKEK